MRLLAVDPQRRLEIIQEMRYVKDGDVHIFKNVTPDRVQMAFFASMIRSISKTVLFRNIKTKRLFDKNTGMYSLAITMSAMQLTPNEL